MNSLAEKAVVLLSGGLDSATVLALAKKEVVEVFALSFRYGQRHVAELDFAKKIADSMSVEDHVVIEIGIGAFGGSSLTDDIDVPKQRSLDEMNDGIPLTYVPARNTIFLAYALGWAEVLGADKIYVGVNSLDYSGYPDCRPEYLRAFEAMANLATKGSTQDGRKISIEAPLIEMTKAEIIARGLSLGVDYSLTSSCYEPIEGGACGECDACILRLDGFLQNNVSDPIRYRELSGQA